MIEEVFLFLFSAPLSIMIYGLNNHLNFIFLGQNLL